MIDLWRHRIEPGALVSWRHANGRTREAAIVVAVTDATLIVDITDNAGTYRFEGTPSDFPGLTVDLRPSQRGV